MTKRIFRGIVLFALAAAILISALVTLTLYETTESNLMEALHAEAGYILHALTREPDDTAYFAGFSSENRVTLIAPDGRVLYDSDADAQLLPNHLDRPEIAGALQTGHGESRRYSNTLSTKTLYYAEQTDDGNVLRVSNTLSSVWGLLARMIALLLLTLIVVAALSLILARRIAKRIVAPINALNLDAPLDNIVYDELSPLLLRMDRQNHEIASQMAALAAKQTELATIAENMREGLILLNADSTVLSMNRSAAAIFGVEASERTGRDMLTVSRDEALHDAVKRACAGTRTEAALERNSRYFQAFANPVIQNGSPAGAVLLLLDVTEQHAAEISRREFTANVSHELKTPLTSISGYAEIIRDGVAKPEDVKLFCARIYNEATRLIALINDILALSRLDEQKGLGERTKVALLPLVTDVAKRLEPNARDKNLTLRVSGAEESVWGYPSLLDEMAFNLADNAVKYTQPGGNVSIEIACEGERTVLRVTDSGIGIPQSDQAHVFERFYRVDKSHSKATGGTGLGLSIVKHCARIHNAAIRLKSQPGQGTCVEIVF